LDGCPKADTGITRYGPDAAEKPPKMGEHSTKPLSRLSHSLRRACGGCGPPDSDSGDLERSCAGFRRPIEVHRTEFFLSGRQLNRSSESAAGFGGSSGSGPNQGRTGGASNRTRRNVRLDSNQGEDPRAGRHRLAKFGGAARGSDSRGGEPGDGENGQIRRWGPLGLTFPRFRAPNGPHGRVSSGHERASAAGAGRSTRPVGVPSVVFPS
jgi:hypothetical protein